MRFSSCMAIHLVQLVVLSGCGGFQLVRYSPGGDFDQKAAWTYEKAPRAPATPLEVLAVKAAREERTVAEGKLLMAVNLGLNGSSRLVAVVETLSADPDRFAVKRVTRYRVRDGNVVATTAPAEEPFPDGEFERGVLIAAERAFGSPDGESVVPYQDGIHNVTMRGKATGRCFCEVSVIDGFNPRTPPLFVKPVNLCDKAR